MANKFSLYYFSGTGNTAKLARLFHSYALQQGDELTIDRIDDLLKHRAPLSLTPGSTIVIFYPIHSFNPPRIVSTFIHTLKSLQAKKIALVFSGADPTFLNNGSSFFLRRVIRKKGGDLFYETHIPLASNAFVRYPDNLSKALYEKAESKIALLYNDLSIQKNKLLPVGPLEYLVSLCGKLESIGARLWGATLRVKTKCTGCGRCVRECPTQNIAMDRGIKFTNNCLMCLRCVYNCPVGAIYSKSMQCVILDGGYDLDMVIEDATLSPVTPEELSRGKYRRFKKYLQNFQSNI